MKPSLLLILSLALPLSAFADMKTIDDASASLENGPASGMFRKLEALFCNGHAPVFPSAPLVGFAGRCFSQASENAVKGGAYMVKQSSRRNGPLDQGLEIQSLWSDQLDRYDHASSRDVCRNQADWVSAYHRDDSLAARLSPTTTSFLRMSGNYYVEKLADPSGRDASYYCYYYLTLTP